MFLNSAVKYAGKQRASSKSVERFLFSPCCRLYNWFYNLQSAYYTRNLYSRRFQFNLLITALIWWGTEKSEQVVQNWFHRFFGSVVRNSDLSPDEGWKRRCLWAFVWWNQRRSHLLLCLWNNWNSNLLSYEALSFSKSDTNQHMALV